MIDVLLARGNFGDDTALLRVLRPAGLSVRTVEMPLSGLDSNLNVSPGGGAPACVVFAVGDARSLVDDGVLDAVARLTATSPGVALIGVIDDRDGGITMGLDHDERSRVIAAVLDAGADDVVGVDLAPCELAARVVAVTRRRTRAQEGLHADAQSPRSADEPALPAAGARPLVDESRRELIGCEMRVALTAKESALMTVLVDASGVVPRCDLEDHLWTGTWSGTKKAVDIHRLGFPAAA